MFFFLSGPPQALTLRPEPRGLSVPQGKVMVLFSLDLGARCHPLLEVLPHKPLGIESLTPSVISLSLFFLQPQLAPDSPWPCSVPESLAGRAFPETEFQTGQVEGATGGCHAGDAGGTGEAAILGLLRALAAVACL